MNEPCVENCAPKRNTSAFVLKKDLTLIDLPPFPNSQWQNGMTPAERQTAAGVYLGKVVDHLQGRENHVWSRSTRPHPHHSRNGRVSQTIKVEGLSDGTARRDPPPQNGEVSENTDE